MCQVVILIFVSSCSFQIFLYSNLPESMVLVEADDVRRLYPLRTKYTPEPSIPHNKRSSCASRERGIQMTLSATSEPNTSVSKCSFQILL
ncbi:hypothetical protein ES319_D01G086300v1 [Gossypium barbadense]|uniref:Secreted protein n=2 Tax=Gossypium TaxID=3633 RepID=A0A5J5SSA3_GOSBA|nr:hypothetical protein ES319_D01G086300v1 [Gossypium barbadense]TYH87098.1 hypothetical protein ES332_D01G092400v1 [Gossypium tomentosum]